MFFWSEDSVRLRHIEALLNRIIERLDTMQAEIDRLKASVTELQGTGASAIALLEGLSALIRDAADDPDEIRAVADSVDATKAALAAAIEANPLPPV